jgi:hypothetical protein
MLREKLEPLVGKAVNMLFARDAALLENDNSEWAVAHRLAVYLERLLPDWNIDCEFTRQGQGTESKTLANRSRVRPDIIVHHRGRVEREHNLLAVELKKTNSTSDQPKVQEYTLPPSGNRRFQYQHGLTLSLRPCVEMTWFENGRRSS